MAKNGEDHHEIRDVEIDRERLQAMDRMLHSDLEGCVNSFVTRETSLELTFDP